FLYKLAGRHERGKRIAKARDEMREVVQILDQLIALLPADAKTRPQETAKRAQAQAILERLEKSVAPDDPDSDPRKDEKKDEKRGHGGAAPRRTGDSMSHVALAFALLTAPAAAPVLAGGTRVADVVSEGDVSHWVIELGGQKIGESWSTYVGLAGKAHRFLGGAILSTPSAVGTLETKR